MHRSVPSILVKKCERLKSEKKLERLKSEEKMRLSLPLFTTKLCWNIAANFLQN